jgi:signal peptidase I
VGVLGSALVAVALVQHYLLAVCVVSGVSMVPTLDPGDRVLVLKPHGEVARGDLLVLHNPLDHDELLIKRVLGLPDDQLYAEDGALWVGREGLFLLDEPYLNPNSRFADLPPTRVPADCYYVLGDNRGQSVDSRRFEAVPERLVVGKLVARLWPSPGGVG